MKKKLMLVMAATILVGAGCKKEGPAEEAGKKLDKAAEKAGDAAKDAGDKIKDATK